MLTDDQILKVNKLEATLRRVEDSRGSSTAKMQIKSDLSCVSNRDQKEQIIKAFT